MSKGHAAKWKELQEVYGVEYVEGGVLRKEGCRSKFFESEDEEGVGPQNVRCTSSEKISSPTFVTSLLAPKAVEKQGMCRRKMKIMTTFAPAKNSRAKGRQRW
jgi:hypothetical protein